MTQAEKQLFLNLCAFASPDKDRIERLINKGAASPELLGHLFANRMAGVAYGVLKKAKLLSSVDREFRNSLKNAHMLNEKLNIPLGKKQKKQFVVLFMFHIWAVWCSQREFFA